MRRKLYFAYGSNMNVKQMKWRCSDAILRGVCKLRGWTLKQRKYADIERKRHGTVYGVLWSISSQDEAALDWYEGVENGFYKKVIVQVEKARKKYKVMAYQMTDEAVAIREYEAYSYEYAMVCTVGAHENGVPVNREFINVVSR